MSSVDLVFDRSAEISALIRGAVKGAELSVAKGLQEHAQKSIREGAKTGRIYNIKGKGRHQASAPGESPAKISGALADGIKLDESGAYGVEVIATDWKSHTLEFGTAGGKIAPRPFMGPGIDEAQAALPAAIAEAVRSVTE